MKIQNSMFFIKRSCSILSRAKTFRSLRKLLVVALAFLLWVPVTHSQNEVGDIHGKLTDSKQNEPIANHPVILNIHKAGDVTQQETTTDENGTYVLRICQLILRHTIHSLQPIMVLNIQRRIWYYLHLCQTFLLTLMSVK